MTRYFVAVGAALGALALPAGALAAPKPRPGANQVSVAANPLRIAFGGTSTISGKLTGNDHAGKTITLQEDVFPFDVFKAVKTATTNSGGDFSFAVQPGANTRYRAVAKTSPDVTSGSVLVAVVPRLTLSANDASVSRGTIVTFSGRLTPAHDGRTVLFQRRSSTGSWVTLRTVVLQDDGTLRSKYSTSLKVRSTGVYRTVFKADADHGTAKSSGRRVSVS